MKNQSLLTTLLIGTFAFNLNAKEAKISFQEKPYTSNTKQDLQLRPSEKKANTNRERLVKEKVRKNRLLIERKISTQRYRATGVPNGGDEFLSNAIPFKDVAPKLLQDAIDLLRKNIKILKGDELTEELYPEELLIALSKQLDKLETEEKVLYLPEMNSILMEVPSEQHSRVIGNRAYTFPHEDSPIYLASGAINYSVLNLANALADELPEQVLVPKKHRYDDNLANVIGIEWSHGHPTQGMISKLKGIYYIDEELSYQANKEVRQELASFLYKLQGLRRPLQMSYKEYSEKYSPDFFINNPDFNINTANDYHSYLTMSRTRLYVTKWFRNSMLIINNINSINANFELSIKQEDPAYQSNLRYRLYNVYDPSTNKYSSPLEIHTFAQLVEQYKNHLDKVYYPFSANKYIKDINQVWKVVKPSLTEHSNKKESTRVFIDKFYKYKNEYPLLDTLDGYQEDLKKYITEYCTYSIGLFSIKKFKPNTLCLENATRELTRQILFTQQEDLN